MTVLETILATILATVTAQLSVKSATTAAIGGLVGNSAYAISVKGFEKLRQAFDRGTDPLRSHPDLKSALYRSYLKAFQSIAKECRDEILGDNLLVYRGTPNIPEPRKVALARLNEQIQVWEKAIQNIETSSAEIDWFRGVETASIAENIGAIKASLIQSMLVNLPCDEFRKKIQAEDGVLWTRMGAYFAHELEQNSDLNIFFQTQVLMSLEIGQSEIQQTLARMEQKIDGSMIKPSDRYLECIDEQKVFEHSENPFQPLTGIVRDETKLFFPEEIIAKVFSYLNNAPGIALIGDEAMGKSTLLKILQLRSGEVLLEKRKPVFIDIATCRNEIDFFGELCYQAGVTQTQDVNQLKRSLGSTKLLLLIDQIDLMSQDGFQYATLKQLRALAESEDIKLGVTANQHLDQLFPNHHWVSPFDGICIPLELKPWSERSINQFIADRLNARSIQFSTADISRLAKESGGNPRVLMKSCFELYERTTRHSS